MGWVRRLVDSVITGWAMPISNTPGRIFGRRIRRTNNVEDGVYTLNEARGVLGVDPIEGGDEPSS